MAPLILYFWYTTYRITAILALYQGRLLFIDHRPISQREKEKPLSIIMENCNQDRPALLFVCRTGKFSTISK